MSRPLSSYPESERKAAAQRRMQSEENGLGKLSAQDFLNRKSAKKVEVKVEVQPEQD